MRAHDRVQTRNDEKLSENKIQLFRFQLIYDYIWAWVWVVGSWAMNSNESLYKLQSPGHRFTHRRHCQV